MLISPLEYECVFPSIVIFMCVCMCVLVWNVNMYVYFRSCVCAGYHGGKKGGQACSGDGESSGCSLVDASLEAIRRECERSDSVTEFVVFHSLSGGTGSGWGDFFPFLCHPSSTQNPWSVPLSCSLSC